MSKCSTKSLAEAMRELAQDIAIHIDAFSTITPKCFPILNIAYHIRLRDLKETGVIKCDDLFITLSDEIDKLFPVKKETKEKKKRGKKCQSG